MVDFEELTQGQKDGFELFAKFYMSLEPILLLTGWAGTGKSTLVQHILSVLPKYDRLCKIVDESYVPRDVHLTATTHQACEALSHLSKESGYPVSTIHSLIGATVRKNLKTGKSELALKGNAVPVENALIIIDEASHIDQRLLGLIYKQTINCKILFIGDNGQLTPVGSHYMPAFEASKLIIELTEVKRQATGPLAELCTALRSTVFGGPWPKIKLDGDQLQHLPRNQWQELAKDAFKDPDTWGNVKILAHTNVAVINMNNYMSQEIYGTSRPMEGQRMLVNEAVINRRETLSTGQEVMIAGLKETIEFDIEGYLVNLRGSKGCYFLPKSRVDYKARLSLARKQDDYDTLHDMEGFVIDLRPSFACTVTKSQGSTFDWVFIDLDDICKKIHHPNQLARALYVAFSRARKGVIMTGDM
ncbi:hypothetical protein AVU12_gp080 [Pseudomonas phage KPP21]|uniref:UvrD-like helicase C-terminal domain-containing protein n=1 Tax=Pseudomonas phage KPP21 TaxID=1678082 RepID=A0A0H5BI91_BPK21|nr:hypothetical protein AVU12_gp080 [Pseudomonas phage KPP21]BAR94639.1 hypothetical protein [Pseudomonas phage KPP21]